MVRLAHLQTLFLYSVLPVYETLSTQTTLYITGNQKGGVFRENNQVIQNPGLPLRDTMLCPDHNNSTMKSKV